MLDGILEDLSYYIAKELDGKLIQQSEMVDVDTRIAKLRTISEDLSEALMTARGYENGFNQLQKLNTSMPKLLALVEVLICHPVIQQVKEGTTVDMILSLESFLESLKTHYADDKKFNSRTEALHRKGLSFLREMRTLEAELDSEDIYNDAISRLGKRALGK